LILAAMASGIDAQDQADPTLKPTTQLPSLQERKDKLANLDLAFPDAPGSLAGDPETRKEFQEAMGSYYEYRKIGYNHRIKVFQWQFFSSKVIFGVVILLMFSGIYFAAVQFHAGLNRKSNQSQEASEFVFSLKGIQVKSPVLGLIVRTISLAFFYLYLVHVYPIVNVF